MPTCMCTHTHADSSHLNKNSHHDHSYQWDDNSFLFFKDWKICFTLLTPQINALWLHFIIFPFHLFSFYFSKRKGFYIFFCQLPFVVSEELLTTLAHFESCSFVVTTPPLLILLAVPATWLMPELIRDKITLTLEAQVNITCPQVTRINKLQLVMCFTLDKHASAHPDT